MASASEGSAGRDKRELRGRVLAGLRATTAPDRAAWSAALGERLAGLEVVRSTGVLMGFLPLVTEPDIERLLRDRLARGGRLVLSRVDWGGARMSAAEVRDLERDLEPGRHGLREPLAHLPEVPAHEIDVVLVPGVAFDARGGRLGRGGGFYDRFLGQAGMRAARVGVCFEVQIVDAVPRERHDALMDHLVTERRSLRL